MGEGARGFLEKQLRRDGVVKGTKRVPAQAEQREEPVARRRMHGVKYLVSAAWSGWQSGRGAGSVGSGSSY